MNVKAIAGALPLGVLWGLPLAAALVLGVARGADADAWSALFEHPQLWPALWLSLFTGIAATGLSLLCTLIILAGLYRSRLWNTLQPMAAAGLALPHLAFAIGFAFLVAPSGLLARLAVGGTQPPQWSTMQDPWGLALIAALVLKEIPFLLVTGWSALARGDQAAHLDGQCRAAASLGHGTGSTWLRIVQPQLLSHLRWPLVIVFVYGSTVVDMALVLGPTQPPTLSNVIWHDLNDAETATNLRGLAGALFMSLALGLVLAASGLAEDIHGEADASPAQRRSLPCLRPEARGSSPRQRGGAVVRRGHTASGRALGFPTLALPGDLATRDRNQGLAQPLRDTSALVDQSGARCHFGRRCRAGRGHLVRNARPFARPLSARPGTSLARHSATGHRRRTVRTVPHTRTRWAPPRGSSSPISRR